VVEKFSSDSSSSSKGYTPTQIKVLLMSDLHRQNGFIIILNFRRGTKL